MDALTAAVVLAWIVLIVLVFAMAGLLQQIHELRAALRRRGPVGRSSLAAPPDEPVSIRPADGKALSAVLLVDGHCPVCAEIAPVFAALARAVGAEIDFVVLSYAANGTGDHLDEVRYLADSDAYHHLDPGWRPAIIVVGPGGEVLAVEPAGSETALRAVITNLVTTGAPSR